MATEVKVDFNPKGFEQILTSDAARALCEQAGTRIRARANAAVGSKSRGFGLHSQNVYAYGSMRNMTFVYTTDRESIIAESEKKALSGAML